MSTTFIKHCAIMLVFANQVVRISATDLKSKYILLHNVTEACIDDVFTKQESYEDEMPYKNECFGKCVAETASGSTCRSYIVILRKSKWLCLFDNHTLATNNALFTESCESKFPPKVQYCCDNDDKRLLYYEINCQWSEWSEDECDELCVDQIPNSNVTRRQRRSTNDPELQGNRLCPVQGQMMSDVCTCSKRETSETATRSGGLWVAKWALAVFIIIGVLTLVGAVLVTYYVKKTYAVKHHQNPYKQNEWQYKEPIRDRMKYRMQNMTNTIKEKLQKKRKPAKPPKLCEPPELDQNFNPESCVNPATEMSVPVPGLLAMEQQTKGNTQTPCLPPPAPPPMARVPPPRPPPPTFSLPNQQSNKIQSESVKMTTKPETTSTNPMDVEWDDFDANDVDDNRSEEKVYQS